MSSHFTLFVFLNLYFSSFIHGGIINTKNKLYNIVKPPSAKYGFNHKLLQGNEIHFNKWTPNSESYIWEHSGLLEGDIMTYDNAMRNGILNQTLHWPNGTVPFFIDEKDFDTEQIFIILNAMREYHERTCIRFRPYEKNDTNWVIIKGNSTGCWSSVGMHEGGQIVNLMTPKCVKHGVVIHELLHALGFYHQQSSANRDDYVKINWENILNGTENNFKKYNDSQVTSYDVEYDYGSVMHYSSKAFSKNGKPTIEALQSNVTLGQRKGLSEKDIIKLNKMYADNCKHDSSDKPNLENIFNDVFNYVTSKIPQIFG